LYTRNLRDPKGWEKGDRYFWQYPFLYLFPISQQQGKFGTETKPSLPSVNGTLYINGFGRV